MTIPREPAPADDVEARRAEDIEEMAHWLDWLGARLQYARTVAIMLRRQQAEIAQLRDALTALDRHGAEGWRRLERCEAALQKHEKNGS